MQPLSQVLNDTLNTQREQPKDTLSHPTNGSLVVTGQTNIATATRQNPLTESQLTQIQSNLLLGLPSITFERKMKYGRKVSRDEFGEVVDPHGVIGEEEHAVVKIDFAKTFPENMLVSALRPSPVEGTMKHLARLFLHKRLGSTPEDRAILTNDYAERLRNYPEFCVYLACRYFWENSESDFAPNLGKLVSLVEGITDCFHEMARARADKPLPYSKPKQIEKSDARQNRAKSAWAAQDWQDHIGDAEHMVKLAEQNPTVFNAEEWQKEADKRRAENPFK